MADTSAAVEKIAEPKPDVPGAPVSAPAAVSRQPTSPTNPAMDTKATEPDPSLVKEKTEKASEKAAAESPDSSHVVDKESFKLQQLSTAARKTGHPEIWGVTLGDPDTHVPSQIIYQKFLNANDGDYDRALEQLTKTLEWRAEHKPLDSLKKAFAKDKFDGLGYVTSYGGDTPETKEVFTWNIYGIVKSMDATFGNVDEFIEWRAALMELALQELNLSAATQRITATEDPYKIFQVHDYLSISFFRQSPAVKAASKETIRVFALAYPELLKEKFFVNVPAIMGFIYGAMKLFVAPKTIKKFHPMSNGGALALEFPDSKVEKLGEKLPAAYGGKGEDLQAHGKTTALE